MSCSAAHGSLDLPERPGDDDGAGGLADDVEGLEDRHARRHQGAQVAGEAGQGELLEEVAEHRQPQLQWVHDVAHALGLAELPPPRHEHDRAHDEDRQHVAHRARKEDQDLGRQRELAAEVLEHARERGDDEDEHADAHEDRQAEDHDGVGQGGLDLAAQPDVGLEVVGDLAHRDVEEAAGLAGPAHADHQWGEDGGVAGEGRRQAVAGLDVLLDVAQHLAELDVVGLVGHDRERAEHGQAGVDHRGELAREDREVLGLDPLLAPEADLALHAAAGRAHLERHVAHRPQPVGHGGLGGRLHLALGELSAGVADGVGVLDRGSAHCQPVGARVLVEPMRVS
jgi:hypothetical protein